MPEPPAAERAMRVLGDVVGDSRPRLPGDGEDPAIPVAATVILVRDAPSGPEVLLIERPDRGSFAGAWVFPGGKLDEGDRVEGATEEDSARRAGIRETWEEVGLVLDGETLVTLSLWDPPPGLPLRIRTWFFIAPAPGGVLALSPDETVAAEWVRPEDLLERHGRGELTLYPPTWVTLFGLAGQSTADAVFAAARLGGLRRYETIARRGETGPMLLWPEDAEYDHDAGVAASARHRLEVGSLPWVYTRGG
ncbi:MAG: NUDIX domain-containing protein [Microbacterium sp.]